MKKRRSRGGNGRNGKAGKAAPKKDGLAVEITGVLLVFLALFALISVVSYTAKDPSFANVPPAGYRVRNFAGSTGAYFSQAILWFLGLAAFFFPFALGYAALRAVLRGTSSHLLRRLGTLTLGLLIICPLLALIFESFPFRGSSVPAGGIIGELLLAFLVRYLSTVGSFIFLLAALATFLLFSTRWSLAKTLRFAKGAFDSTAKEVRIQVTDYRKPRKRTRCGRGSARNIPRPPNPPRPTPRTRKRPARPRRRPRGSASGSADASRERPASP